MYGIAQSRDVRAAKAVLSNVMVPEFVPQRGVKIQVNEAEAAAAAAGGDVDEMQLDSIAAALPERSTLAKLSPVEFEKDDETYVRTAVLPHAECVRFALPLVWVDEGSSGLLHVRVGAWHVGVTSREETRTALSSPTPETSTLHPVP